MVRLKENGQIFIFGSDNRWFPSKEGLVGLFPFPFFPRLFCFYFYYYFYFWTFLNVVFLFISFLFGNLDYTNGHKTLHYPVPLRITWQELAAAYEAWTQRIERNGGPHYKMYIRIFSGFVALLRYCQLGWRLQGLLKTFWVGLRCYLANICRLEDSFTDLCSPKNRGQWQQSKFAHVIISRDLPGLTRGFGSFSNPSDNTSYCKIIYYTQGNI